MTGICGRTMLCISITYWNTEIIPALNMFETGYIASEFSPIQSLIKPITVFPGGHYQ
jgi:hypothetical protein